MIKSVRKFSKVPIIVLTARTDDFEVVEAFKCGADDYVTKPFGARILVARIKANLRNVTPRLLVETLENGPILIDITRHQILVDTTHLKLSSKEFAILEQLMRKKGKIMTHKQLIRAVWGDNQLKDTHYLRIYVCQLREKLADASKDLRDSIVSETGVGYRIEAIETKVA